MVTDMAVKENPEAGGQGIRRTQVFRFLYWDGVMDVCFLKIRLKEDFERNPASCESASRVKNWYFGLIH